MAKPNMKAKSKQILDSAKARTRDGLDKGYEAKRPYAKTALEELRVANPKATPNQIQEILDKNLVDAEARFGSTSAKFSTAATIYVMTSVELRELDIKSTSGHQKLVDLMVMFDSAGVKFVRRAINLAIWVLPFMKGAKVAKIVGGVTVAASGASKIAKRVQGKYSVADFLITKTNKTLGPIQVSWAIDEVEEKPKRKGLRRLWK